MQTANTWTKVDHDGPDTLSDVFLMLLPIALQKAVYFLGTCPTRHVP